MTFVLKKDFIKPKNSSELDLSSLVYSDIQKNGQKFYEALLSSVSEISFSPKIINLNGIQAIDFSQLYVSSEEGLKDAYSFKLLTAFSLLLNELNASSFKELKEKISVSKIKLINVASGGSFAAATIIISNSLGLKVKVFLAKDESGARKKLMLQLGASEVENFTYLQEAVFGAREVSACPDSIFLHPYEDIACAYASFGMTKFLLANNFFPEGASLIVAGGGLGLAAGMASAFKSHSDETAAKRVKIFVTEEARVGKITRLVSQGMIETKVLKTSLVPSCNTGSIANYALQTLYFFIDGVIPITNEEILKGAEYFKDGLSSNETSPILSLVAAEKLIKKSLDKKEVFLASICGRLQQ